MERILQIEQMATEERNETIRNIVKREGRRLWSYIRHRVRNDFEADDILQDVFYSLTNALQSRTIDNIVSWLFKVAGNRIIDTYRKHKTLSIDDTVSSSSNDKEGGPLHLGEILFDRDADPDDLFLRSTVWPLLSEALNELPPEQRDVFILHELEDKSFREISEETGVGINTLFSRKRYAILHLRERLHDLYDIFFNK
jgi:RNA polymerase sigma factor (sigma-70 family)